MKFALAAAFAVLSLVFLSDLSVAQTNNNKKNAMGASVIGATCTTGQTCSANCDSVGWCSRMVCAGNKWEKRLLSCVGSLCPPKC